MAILAALGLIVLAALVLTGLRSRDTDNDDDNSGDGPGRRRPARIRVSTHDRTPR